MPDPTTRRPTTPTYHAASLARPTGNPVRHASHPAGHASHPTGHADSAAGHADSPPRPSAHNLPRHASPASQPTGHAHRQPGQTHRRSDWTRWQPGPAFGRQPDPPRQRGQTRQLHRWPDPPFHRQPGPTRHPPDQACGLPDRTRWQPCPPSHRHPDPPRQPGQTHQLPDPTRWPPDPTCQPGQARRPPDPTRRPGQARRPPHKTPRRPGASLPRRPGLTRQTCGSRRYRFLSAERRVGVVGSPPRPARSLPRSIEKGESGHFSSMWECPTMGPHDASQWLGKTHDGARPCGWDTVTLPSR
jgi:hypothetical protein